MTPGNLLGDRFGAAGRSDFAHVGMAGGGWSAMDDPARSRCRENLNSARFRARYRSSGVRGCRRPETGCVRLSTAAAQDRPGHLTERHAVSPAVAACAGMWLRSQDNPGTALHIALITPGARPRATAGRDLPEGETEVPFGGPGRRTEHDLSYCLDSAPVSG